MKSSVIPPSSVPAMTVTLEGVSGGKQAYSLTGQNTIIVPQGSSRIIIATGKGGLSATELQMKKSGNDLIVRYPDEHGGQGELVLKDYYPEAPSLQGYNSQGELAAWQVPDSLSSSSFTDVMLSDSPLMESAVQTGTDSNSFWNGWWPWALGVGTLVGGGAAIASRNSDDNDNNNNNNKVDSNSPTPSAPPSPAGYVDDVGLIQSVDSTAAQSDDTRPGFNVGTGLPGSPALYVDGNKVESDYDASTGILTPRNPLPDGPHAITTTLTFTEGRESAQSAPLNITIASVALAAPTAPAGYEDDVGSILSPASTAPQTDDTRPSFKVGKNLAGTPVLYVDGQKVAADYDATAGTLTPVTPLTDGPHTITTTLISPAGIESQQGAPLNITVDTIAPDAPAAPAGYADDSGSIQSPDSVSPLTDDNLPGFNVGKDLTGIPTLYIDGQKVASDYDATTGILTPRNALPDGPHAITTTLTDASGNESPQGASLNISVDTTPPAAGQLTLANFGDTGSSATDFITRVNEFDLTLNNLEPGASARYEISTDGGNTWLNTLSQQNLLPDGKYLFRAAITDAAGNSATTPVLTVIVDTTAPTAPMAPAGYLDNVGAVVSTNNTAPQTDDTRPGFNVGIGLADTPFLYIDGVKVEADYDATMGTLTPRHSLPEASYTVTFTLTDVAGNESPQSEPLNITVNTTVPFAPVVFTSYADDVGSIISNDSTVAQTDDTRPGFNVGKDLVGTPALYVDGNKVAAEYDATTGILTPVDKLSDGQHTITTTMISPSGIESPQSPGFSLTVDSQAPAAGTLSLPGFEDTGVSATDSISYDNTFDLTVSGNEVGSTVSYEISSDNGATWTATQASQANLADGTWQFRAVITDAVGNTSTTKEKMITLDTVGPATPPSAATGYVDDVGTVTNPASTAPLTDDNRPGIIVGTGITERLSLYVDGVKVASGYNPTTGTLTPRTPLEDGEHTITYTLGDAAGNESPHSAPLKLTVDATVTTGTLKLAGFDDTGSSTADFITRDNIFDLTVVDNEAGSTVKYEISRDNGSSWVTTEANQSGLADGTYLFRAVVTDQTGTTGETDPQTVIVDTTAPSTGQLALASATFEDTGSSTTDGITMDNTFDLSLSGNETGSIVRYEISRDNGSTWETTEASQVNLTDGAYQFRAVVTDAAGNFSNTLAQNVTVDTTAPLADIQSLSLTGFEDTGSSTTDFITQDRTFGLTMSDIEPGSSVTYEVSVNGGADWMPTGATQTNLVDGSYQFRAVVTDVAGNKATTQGRTITVDNIAPVSSTLVLKNFEDTGTSTSDFISHDSTFDLSLKDSEAGSSVKYEISLDGGATWTPTDEGQTALSDGNYLFRGQVTDAAGNVTDIEEQAVTIDTRPTVLTVEGMSNDYGTHADYRTWAQSAKLNGTATAGSSIKVYMNNEVVDTFVVDSSGIWQSKSLDISALSAGQSVPVRVEALGTADAVTVTVDKTLYKEGQVIDTTTLTAAEGLVIEGASDDLIGFAASSAGDINNDGIDDLLLGAFGGANSGVSAGQAYVLFGNQNGSFGTEENGRQVFDVRNHLSSSAGFIIQGTRVGDSLGYSTTSVGDVNGDGISDLVIGAPTNSNGGTGNIRFSGLDTNPAGEAYVIYGRGDNNFGQVIGTQNVLNTATLSAQEGVVIRGQGPDRLGQIVKNLGDINDDGIDDMAFYAPYAGDSHVRSIGSYNGYDSQVTVVYGRENSTFGTSDSDNRIILPTGSLGQDKGFTIEGVYQDLGTPDAIGLTGITGMAEAGDIDQDGINDLFISTYKDMYVVYGRSDNGFGTVQTNGSRKLDLANFTQQDGFIIPLNGDNPTYTIPLNNNAMSVISDINGDQLDDYLISVTGADGRTYVLFGKDEGITGTVSGTQSILDLSTMTQEDGFIIRTPALSPANGVSSAGDINGDGIEDVVVGAFQDGPSGAGAGEAYVIFGQEDGVFGTLDTANNMRVLDTQTLSSQSGFIIQGAPGRYLGQSVSAAGDINQDGFDDLLVGENHASYVIYGNALYGTGLMSHPIDGTPGNDWLTGTDAGEQITGSGGMDVILANGGNDTVVLNDTNFRRIDGGAGEDLVLISGHQSQTLDFAALAKGTVTGVEQIDINGSGANTIKLSLQNVMDMSDTSDTLLLKGGSDDNLQISGMSTSGQTELVDNVSYLLYQGVGTNSAQLLVDQDIRVTVV